MCGRDCLRFCLARPSWSLVAVLARRLFPESRWPRYAAPWLLLTFTYGFLFGLQVMYEVLLAVCVLTALLALVPSARREQPHFVLFALAIGLGLLTKGPVMLLHVAFPLAAWSVLERLGETRASALVRAGRAGVAGRLRHARGVGAAGCAGGRRRVPKPAAFPSNRRARRQCVRRTPSRCGGIWPLLPVVIFPFALWPRLWLALGTLRRPLDSGTRFLIAWLAPVLLTFSLISGKQLYYLLPEYAGFALLQAAVLAQRHRQEAGQPHNGWLGPWPLALLNLTLALALILLPSLVRQGTRAFAVADRDGSGEYLLWRGLSADGRRAALAWPR